MSLPMSTSIRSLVDDYEPIFSSTFQATLGPTSTSTCFRCTRSGFESTTESPGQLGSGKNSGSREICFRAKDWAPDFCETLDYLAVGGK